MHGESDIGTRVHSEIVHLPDDGTVVPLVTILAVCAIAIRMQRLACRYV